MKQISEEQIASILSVLRGYMEHPDTDDAIALLEALPSLVQKPPSELEKDAANLLFALHEAWPYVHGNCTIGSKIKTIQALMIKHGDFADLHPPAQPSPARKREHITDGTPCWCYPEVNYVDPDTGVAVIVHKEPQ